MNDTAELYWECLVTVKPPLNKAEWNDLERISKKVNNQKHLLVHVTKAMQI